MKLSVERGQFLSALSHGNSVVQKKNTIPILSHVLLQAEGGTLTITTTDMDLALVETLPAVIESPGAITIPAQTLFDIVRKLPENSMVELTLNSENGQVSLKAGKSHFNLSSLSAELFPKLTQDDLPFSFKLPTQTLLHLIDKAKFAMSTDDVRYYLNGIYFHTKDTDGKKIFRSVATDAHRLACIEIEVPDGAEDMPGIIVGRKTLEEVRKLLDDQKEGDVTVSLSSRRIQFQLPNATLSSRLIDGAFPDYERAIPLDNDKTIIVDTKALAQAVDRVATVASTTSDKIRIITMNITENAMNLSAASHEVGDATEELAVDYPFDTPVKISLNARYLLDIAQQIKDDETQIQLQNEDAPAVIRGIQDNNSIFVIMPLRG